jgi:hypothetical protein
MAATAERLKEWFDRGVEEGARWMVVIMDTFDYDDYPVYFTKDKKKECLERIAQTRDGKNMQRLLEVYDLSINKEEQFQSNKRVMLIP